MSETVSVRFQVITSNPALKDGCSFDGTDAKAARQEYERQITNGNADEVYLVMQVRTLVFAYKRNDKEDKPNEAD